MMANAMKKFLIFALLFAGTVEAVAPVDKSSDDKITVSGSYNPFTVSSCSTTDKYIQGSAKINYDKRFHKNWEFHSAAAYSRSKRISHSYSTDQLAQSDPPSPAYKNSGFSDLGISFWWDYLRIRGDFTLFIYDTYQEEYLADTLVGIKKKINFLPMGGGLIEAGKMDFLWVSTGFFHHEYPYGFFQFAINGNIMNKVELGGGFVIIPFNHSTWKPSGETLPTPFIRMKVQVDDLFALKTYIHFNYYVETMFEGSLGLEVSF